MAQTASIFVQIPAYRDPELVPTLKDLFAKAAHPERVFAGVCWQYKLGEDKPTLDIPKDIMKQVRIHAATTEESQGASWAKHQAQKLYKGEDYVLMIDSHMRFVKGWDALLIKQLSECTSAKSVITHLPPKYTLPDVPDTAGKLTVLRAHYPTQGGDIRVRGELLDVAPENPLRGAFAAPGLLFAKAALIKEVPYDPHLYFEQEEMCLSARLFTHGWDVYHPSAFVAYHLYDATPTPFPRHKHWQDNPGWGEYNRRGRERCDHLLGVQLASSEAALTDIDLYGHGEARSPDEFAAFCGIHFAAREVTQRALTAGFVANLSKYRNTPAAKPEVPATKPAAAPMEKHEESAKEYTTAPQKTGRSPRPSTFSMDGVHHFKPASTDILSRPIFIPHLVADKYAKEAATAPKPRILTDGVPPGVLVVENYMPPAVCKYFCDQADRIAGTQLKVVDHDASTSGKVATKASEGRITEHVSINTIASDVISTFMDIHWNRLAPYYGVTFEWFERPQILRYPAGGKYNAHADAEHLSPKTKLWMRSLDRDISCLLYLNEEYEGGSISLEKFGYAIKPKTGMLIAFPSDHRYLHAALPTTSGIRYAIVSWAATLGSSRVKDSPPYASTMLHLPN